MTIKDLKSEIVHWKLSKGRIIHFAIGIGALLIYELVARPYYRPFIYSGEIDDFHIADTIGNSLGTIAAIFIFLALLTDNHEHGKFIMITVTISLVLYELAQPILGKPIDLWDILATVVSGTVCYLFYQLTDRKWKQ